jgi:hypothetical protein
MMGSMNSTSKFFYVIEVYATEGTRAPGVFDTRSTMAAAKESARRLNSRRDLIPREFLAVTSQERDEWPVREEVAA